MTNYLILNPLSAGIAGGVIGAVMIFLTTISGIFGFSKAAKRLEESVWKNLGYKVNWFGAIWGAVLGFVYGFLIWWIFSLIYNAVI